MQTVDTSQLPEVIASFKEAAQAALSNEDCQSFEHIEKQLSEMEGYVRELQQAMWTEEAWETLRRLESDEPLTATDKQVIRTFLVSDAEHYLATENNFGDWTRELRRIMDELVRKSSMVSRENIGELRAIMMDAMRLVPDIRNYLTERHRVERFDVAVDHLDEPTRKMLIRIIREQVESPDR